MRFGSICSGIEAASVAWQPLGWRPSFLSEIAAFPRAVLQHRFPEARLHGDFTTIEAGDYEPIDVLVGGTPCQDFSVAGLRAGITGDRGNLTLEFIRLAQRLRPTWIVFENVPGLLSDDSGRAFGAFLGGLAVIGYGFAYRVLDAQFAGLAQRRERVFVIGYLGDWRPAAAVLFERHGLSWDPAPRRGTRQAVARSAADGAASCGGYRGGAADDLAFTVRPPAKHARWRGDGADNFAVQPLGLGDDGELARALNACETATGRLDVSVDTFVATCITGDVTHTLRAEGSDASEDGTGRGTPIIPTVTGTLNHNGKAAGSATQQDAECGMLVPTIGFNARQDPDSWIERAGPLDTRSPQGQAIAFQDRFRGDDGRGYDRPPPVFEEITGTLETVKPWHVAFDTTQITHPENRRNPQPGDPCHPLAAQGHAPAIAFQTRVARNGRGSAEEEIVPALNGADAGATSDMRPCVATPKMAVRRLTPRECERLQGFPDDWTLVPYRGKPAKDGPRYQALGNSMAVPVVRWLGERIDMVQKLISERGDQ